MNSTFSSTLAAIPDSSNLARMLMQMVPQLQNLIARFQESAPTPVSTLAFETALHACCREGCRVLLEAEYNDIEPAALQDCPVRLRLAGEEYKRRPKSPNYIGTLFGPIRLDRYYYEAIEPGERGIFPLEMHLGIEAGLATPALAERLGRQTVDHTQQEVLEWLERDHGLKWSPESLRKVAAALSAGLCGCRQSAQEEKILAWLQQAQNSRGRHQPVLVVGRDGIMVPLRHGAYQEAATATISVMDRRGKRLGTVYLGQMPESGQGTLSDQLTALLKGVLAQWDGPLRYVYVTDAGNHPQEYYEKVLRKMEDPRRPGRLLGWQWIVDFWHACLYLTKLREGLFGDTAEGWAWFKRVRHWLRHRKFGVVEILRSATQHYNRLGLGLDAERDKKFREGYRYLRKYARRMAYARYHREGKPIGSGITEAACKTVFTQRLKQSGMRWSVEGGQVIVNLRVIRLSGVWLRAFDIYQQSRTLPMAYAKGSSKHYTPQILKIAA